MTEGMHHEPRRPKLHGSFTLTRLAGAGVVLNDNAAPETPGHASLVIGDSATHVVLLGTLDEIHTLLDEARRQVAERRTHQRDGA